MTRPDWSLRNKITTKLDVDFKSGKSGSLYIDGHYVNRVVIHVHRKDVPPGTYQSIAKSLHLTVEELNQLHDCPLKKEAAKELIRQRSMG
jgi:hypothetical protein